MSLDWNVAKVANNETVCFRIADADDAGRGISKGDKLLQVATEGLIFATMAVGLGRITEANHREFFARLNLHEKLNGGMRYGPAPDHARILYTLADVRAHIGLTTNVSDETAAKWRARYLDNAAREALYVADQAERRAKAEAA
ncbi:hypothetical protein FANBOY_01070 [Brevundimonas phage vB_BgoS-Fanboy]|nr:hypothetical protein FANBOY_01070 [Brevundimonas phage vB_BgoS-Fanboy]